MSCKCKKKLIALTENKQTSARQTRTHTLTYSINKARSISSLHGSRAKFFISTSGLIVVRFLIKWLIKAFNPAEKLSWKRKKNWANEGTLTRPRERERAQGKTKPIIRGREQERKTGVDLICNRELLESFVALSNWHQLRPLIIVLYLPLSLFFFFWESEKKKSAAERKRKIAIGQLYSDVSLFSVLSCGMSDKKLLLLLRRAATTLFLQLIIERSLIAARLLFSRESW